MTFSSGAQAVLKGPTNYAEGNGHRISILVNLEFCAGGADTFRSKFRYARISILDKV
jgi:hypothetical protein